MLKVTTRKTRTIQLFFRHVVLNLCAVIFQLNTKTQDMRKTDWRLNGVPSDRPHAPLTLHSHKRNWSNGEKRTRWIYHLQNNWNLHSVWSKVQNSERAI